MREQDKVSLWQQRTTVRGEDVASTYLFIYLMTLSTPKTMGMPDQNGLPHTLFRLCVSWALDQPLGTRTRSQRTV